MSMATYESLIQNIKIDSAIEIAEAQLQADGELYDARTALQQLRTKHLG